MKWLVVALTALGLMGCSSAPNSKAAPDGVVAFKDAAGQVHSAAFAPLPLDCTQALHCPTLGLQWSDSKPQQAVLTVGFTRAGHAPVQMVEFLARPNGPMRVRTLAPEQPSDPSLKAFQVPMDTLERVVISHGVVLRVSTADGQVYEESLTSGEQSSRAFNALKRWLQQIYQGQEKEQSLGLRGVFFEPYQR